VLHSFDGLALEQGAVIGVLKVKLPFGIAGKVIDDHRESDLVCNIIIIGTNFLGAEAIVQRRRGGNVLVAHCLGFPSVLHRLLGGKRTNMGDEFRPSFERDGRLKRLEPFLVGQEEALGAGPSQEKAARPFLQVPFHQRGERLWTELIIRGERRHRRNVNPQSFRIHHCFSIPCCPS
jgi:hypothetical protein